MRTRRSRLLAVSVVVLLLVAGAGAAIAANVALLGYAGRHNDPVGNLSPRAIVAPAGEPAPPAAPVRSEAADD